MRRGWGEGGKRRKERRWREDQGVGDVGHVEHGGEVGVKAG